MAGVGSAFAQSRDRVGLDAELAQRQVASVNRTEIGRVAQPVLDHVEGGRSVHPVEGGGERGEVGRVDSGQQREVGQIGRRRASGVEHALGELEGA